MLMKLSTLISTHQMVVISLLSTALQVMAGPLVHKLLKLNMVQTILQSLRNLTQLTQQMMYCMMIST